MLSVTFGGGTGSTLLARRSPRRCRPSDRPAGRFALQQRVEAQLDTLQPLIVTADDADQPGGVPPIG